MIVWKTIGPITETVLREDVEPQLAAMGIKP